MDKLSDLIAISRFGGERFDLVQAGGGNTSQRLGDKLYVKASGLALSAVSKEDDFCCVQWAPLVEFLDRADDQMAIKELDETANKAVAAVMEPSKKRPSIETLLHCALGPLTLHTHPIAVTAMTCRNDWQSTISQLFIDAILVEYKTPGPALALALRKQLKKRDWRAGDPALIFLQNHGLIVSAADKNTVVDLTNSTVDTLNNALNVNLKRYQIVNFTSNLVNKICGCNWLSYLSDDQLLKDCLGAQQSMLLAAPLTPDQLVYCGPTGLVVDATGLTEAEKLTAAYFAKFGHPPRVILARTGTSVEIVFMAQSLSKCKESEDVLKSVILLQQGGKADTLQFLSNEEVNYLSNWEAEKYRQSL